MAEAMPIYERSNASTVARFAPEFQLALACARWPLCDRDREDIQRLMVKSLDWGRFAKIIERNQILPLAYHNLNECLPGAPQVCETFRRKARGFASQTLSQVAELVRISEKVRKAGLEVVTLKGVSLSLLAYGNVAMRSPGDIDLLAAPEQVFEIEKLLIDLGYIRGEPKAELTPRRLNYYLKYYKHFTYFSPTKGIPLELHWRLFHNEPLMESNPKPWATVTFPLGSGIVSTLSKNELFLYLCVHGAIHGWPILKWLADIGALLSNMDEEGLRAVSGLASEHGLMGELGAALILVDSFLAVQRPAIELPKEPNQVAARIVGMAERLLTAEDYCLEIERLPRMAMFVYDLKMRSSWRYRSQDLRRAFVLPDDWELINLPDALFPLYAAVRPVSWLFRRARGLSKRRIGTGHSSS
jgi:hypothetical protein